MCVVCVYAYVHVCALMCIHVHMGVYLPLYSLVGAKVNLELSSSVTLYLIFLITNEFLLFYVYGYFICISMYLYHMRGFGSELSV